MVSYLIEEYSSGRTANPNVLCNTRIKFGAFLDAIGDMGFHYVASRNYANAINSCDYWMDEPSVKDQTYFLSHLSQSQLKRLLSPLGCIPKIPENLLPGLQLLEGQMLANQYCLIILLGYPTKTDMQASGLVISASPGGPAYRTGVSSGDVILAIDDTSTENMGWDYTMQLKLQ
ncbi:hypothetical protein VNO78_20359 [Psophocarpus tetragonolobus]|uniref:PDZ domain-containing protein n=1 Tax=Psophocarpus tetragonolobus TaxID=3891 RepID=A0AAN9SA63_PSOTE